MKGRFYAVSGAASGIGQAVAVRLANLGAAGISISDINSAGLNATKAMCTNPETRIMVENVDVSNRDQVDQWIGNTLREFGRLDGAANIAGIAGGTGNTTCATMKDEDWNAMIGINLTGVMNCMRAQLPHMPSPGGSIVNVSSTSGLRGLPHNAGYASSKFGVIGLTESAAGEFGSKGIRINALLPGPIDTAIFRDGEKKGLFDSKAINAGTLLGRMGKADEVAKVLCFLLSDDTSYVTGAHWTVDGGYAAC